MRIARIMYMKEITESIRKSRFFVMGIVFLLFGITSPLTAKYLPEIVSWILHASADTVQIPIELPDPTIFDSYIQLYQNLAQMGIFVQIFVFMGMISDEKSSGSAVLVLTKAVPRYTFVLAKYTAAATVLLVTLLPSFLAFYYYTYVLFDQWPSGTAITGIFLFYLFSLFILAITLFASTISKKTSISALIALGGYFSLSILSVIPKVSDYFPTKLTQAAYEVSAQVSSLVDFSKSVVVSIIGILVLVTVSVLLFNKQEL